jgi:KUP system potassium uptake protein
MLHENNLIVSVVTEDIPQVSEADRVSVTPISDRFSVVCLRFGFMQRPNVPRSLATARKLGLKFDIMTTSFFLSRRSLKPSQSSRMPNWQDRLFIGMSRTANDASDYFQIPTGRVVELGTQIAV